MRKLRLSCRKSRKMFNIGEFRRAYRLKEPLFKRAKKRSARLIAEKNSTPNQILEWFVNHFVRNVKMVSKSLRIFF